MSIKITFRLGSVVPTTEFLDVGEPIFDSDKFRFGLGIGNNIPVWYPRVDVENQDLVNIGSSMHRSEVGGKPARFGYVSKDTFAIQTLNGYRLVVGDSSSTFYNKVHLTQGGSLAGDIDTNGGRFTAMNVQEITISSSTQKINIKDGQTGNSIGSVTAYGVTSRAQQDLILALGGFMAAQTQMLRNTYASGLVGARGYRYHEPFNVKVKRHRGGFSAMNIHNHPDFRGVAGMAEVAFLVNGYFFQTRHNDYRLMRPIKSTTFGERALNTGVPVPASVSNLPSGYTGTTINGNLTGSQVEWMRNVYQNNPEQCVFELSYLELWIQKFDQQFLDIASSTRHANESREYKKLLEMAQYYINSGYKIPSENAPIPAGVITTIDADGHPVLGYVNWRIGSLPVATMSNRETTLTMDGYAYDLKALPLNINKALKGIIDGTNRFKLRRNMQDLYVKPVLFGNDRFKVLPEHERQTWQQIYNSNLAMFDVEGLDDLCRMIPGFNGMGSYETLRLDDYYKFRFSGAKRPAFYSATNPRGLFYYDNSYTVNRFDAVGESILFKGYNDPNLFTAYTTFNNVIHNHSFMLPLELILRTPRENWNPFNVPQLATVTGDGSTARPYNGWNDYGVFMRIPQDAILPSPDVPSTSADTRNAAWVSTPSGLKPMLSSGLRIFDYDGHRRRFPVIPESFKFSQNNVEFEWFKHIIKGLLKKASTGSLTDEDIDAVF